MDPTTSQTLKTIYEIAVFIAGVWTGMVKLKIWSYKFKWFNKRSVLIIGVAGSIIGGLIKVSEGYLPELQSFLISFISSYLLGVGPGAILYYLFFNDPEIQTQLEMEKYMEDMKDPKKAAEIIKFQQEYLKKKDSNLPDSDKK